MIEPFKVVQTPCGTLDIAVSNDLEAYRASSLYEKEAEMIAWIKSWSVENPIFFDVGANIGLYSCFVGATVSSVEAYCFEPVSNNFARLCQNLELNQLENCNAFNLALSDRNSLISLEVKDKRVGGSGSQVLRPGENKNRDGSSIVKVLCFSLDYLVDSLGFPCPNYLKIDVDGIELKILEGCVKSILDNRALTSIYVEANSKAEANDIKSLLETFSFYEDKEFENIEGHSTNRRREAGSEIRNLIFSRA